MKLWCVGKIDSEFGDWQLMGIFDDEKTAVAACTTAYHFVGPETLNVLLPDERMSWPGAYYPLVEPARVPA
jgi:hypothetical protein